jgi:hypothetical protein
VPGDRQRQLDDDVSAVNRDVRAADEDVLATVTRYDPYWGGQVLIGVAILLDLSLADKVTLGPSWLLPALEGLALLGLTMASPHPRIRHSPLRRHFALTLIGVVTAANCYSLILLCHYLLQGGKAVSDGHALIGSGLVLWVTNVLLFSVWYWQLDGGGPVARRGKIKPYPDFLFVQMTERKFAPRGWHPALVDYLYTSFTNATAFSPTDTMPLTVMAKALMAVQSAIALVTIGLVVARAVNILG